MSKLDVILDVAEKIAGRASTRCDACGARHDAADDRYPVKLEIELSHWDSMPQLIEFLEYVRSSANGGHSFILGADTDADGPGQMFGKQRCGAVVSVDGDGADKIGRIWINGEELK